MFFTVVCYTEVTFLAQETMKLLYFFQPIVLLIMVGPNVKGQTQLVELDCLRDHEFHLHECAIYSNPEIDEFNYCAYKTRLFEMRGLPPICGVKYTLLEDPQCTNGAQIWIFTPMNEFHDPNTREISIPYGNREDLCSKKSGESVTYRLSDLLVINSTRNPVKYKIKQELLCCDGYPNKPCCQTPTPKITCDGRLTDVYQHSILIGTQYVNVCSYTLQRTRLWCQAEFTLIKACTGHNASIRINRLDVYLTDICKWKVQQKEYFTFGRWSLEVSLANTYIFEIGVKYVCDPPKNPLNLPKIACDIDSSSPTVINKSAILVGMISHYINCTYSLVKRQGCKEFEIFVRNDIEEVCNFWPRYTEIIMKRDVGDGGDIDMCKELKQNETRTFQFGTGSDFQIELYSVWDFYFELIYKC